MTRSAVLHKKFLAPNGQWIRPSFQKKWGIASRVSRKLDGREILDEIVFKGQIFALDPGF